MIASAEAHTLRDLVTPTAEGIASRVLLRVPGGSVTLFAFDAGESMSEHTSPFEVLVMVLEGVLDLTVGGTRVRAEAGAVVRMPAGVPHALDAPVPARMLLIMLRAEAPEPPGPRTPGPQDPEDPRTPRTPGP